MIAAQIGAPHVMEFCQGLVAELKLVIVSCHPLVGKPLNDCFTIIPEHISHFSGEQDIGWAILERPRVFVEGELNNHLLK